MQRWRSATIYGRRCFRGSAPTDDRFRLPIRSAADHRSGDAPIVRVAPLRVDFAERLLRRLCDSASARHLRTNAIVKSDDRRATKGATLGAMSALLVHA